VNTQHTPGPWRVATTPDSPREKAVRLTRFHSIGVNGGPAIAMLPDGQRDIQDANARLIAVAPELLAALEDVTEALIATDRRCNCDSALGSRELSERGNVGDRGGPHHESCPIGKILRARSAIAKAVRP
jgi:hypothetical protein